MENVSFSYDGARQILDDINFDSRKRLKLLEKFDKVLGLGIKNVREEELAVPEEVMKLIEARERLRKEKMWAEADIIRERIREKGFKVEDKAAGPRIEKI